MQGRNCNGPGAGRFEDTRTPCQSEQTANHTPPGKKNTASMSSPSQTNLKAPERNNDNCRPNMTATRVVREGAQPAFIYTIKTATKTNNAPSVQTTPIDPTRKGLGGETIDEEDARGGRTLVRTDRRLWLTTHSSDHAHRGTPSMDSRWNNRSEHPHDIRRRATL